MRILLAFHLPYTARSLISVLYKMYKYGIQKRTAPHTISHRSFIVFFIPHILKSRFGLNIGIGTHFKPRGYSRMCAYMKMYIGTYLVWKRKQYAVRRTLPSKPKYHIMMINYLSSNERRVAPSPLTPHSCASAQYAFMQYAN